LANPVEAFSRNANEIAAITHTSPATISRFSRKIGFSSFFDAKLSMVKTVSPAVQNVEPGVSLFIDRDDSYQQCASKLIAQINDVCDSALRLMNFDNLAKAIERIYHADIIYLAGVGASGVVAKDLYIKLNNIKRKIRYCEDPHINVDNMLGATSKDVLIAFSYSGETKFTIRALEIAKEQGAFTIAISGNSNSMLTQKADVVLQSPAIEQRLRVGAVSSHYSQQFVSDLLFLGLVTNLYDQANTMIHNTSKALDGLK
ncbi:MAG: MurR/RpiR family transcriptional regulator, partial [Sphaerochaetaceae bacterium]